MLTRDPTIVLALFQVLVHIVLVGAAFAPLLLTYIVIAKFTTGWQETIMRSAAAVCGLLLYIGAKALGLSIPALLLHALGQSTSYTTGLVGALLPALTGILVAWYVTSYFNSRNERQNLVGTRILALVMTVVFFLYADCYAATADAVHHDEAIKLPLPNLTFTLAVLLYAVFRYIPLPRRAGRVRRRS